jgi:hypothetical protein
VPFSPDEPVQLEQVARNRFRLLKGFSYTDPRGETHDIDPGGVGESDLASVPWILWWFVASYGRHTRAALVHDQLVDQIERHLADRVFRDALKEAGVRWMRRWLIWTAVSFETTFRTLWRPFDATRPGVRTQRTGRLVTVGGFLAVFAHLAFGVALAVWSWDGRWFWQLVAAAVLVSWFLFWRVRAMFFLTGLVLIVPAMLVLLVPLLVVWVLEGGVWWLINVALWYVIGRKKGKRRPEGPGLGPTRYGGLARV